MTLVSRINRQEEYCLSLARILTSRYQSRVDDRMKIECTSSSIGKDVGGIRSESQCCPAMKDQ